MSLGTRGVGLRRKGGWVHGSHSRTMFRAIPGEKFSREDQENQHEGKSVGLCRL
jgi:hypothetical protein